MARFVPVDRSSRSGPRSRRRRLLVPVMAATAAMALLPRLSQAQVETAYIGPADGLWSNPLNWSNGLPQAAGIADLFSPLNVNYDLNAPVPDLAAVQIAGGTAAATLTLSNAFGSPVLQTAALDLGGSTTGVSGASTGTGAGWVLQSAGLVDLDPGVDAVSMQIDSISGYNQTGGVLISGSQTIGGQFLQSAGLNQLSSGSLLTVAPSGSYNLSGTGQLTSDSQLILGNFLQLGGANQIAPAASLNIASGGIYNLAGGQLNGGSESIAGQFIQSGGTNQLSSGTLLTVTPGGVYNQTGGSLLSGSQDISGQFAQSAGSNQLSSGSLLTVTSSGNYNLSAVGQLTADSQLIAGNFLQLGGVNQITSSLNIAGGGIYNQAGGQLMGGSEFITGQFIQSGGINQLGSGALLTVNSGGVYNQTGGQIFAVATTVAGTFLQANGSNQFGSTFNVLPGATVNFSGGSLMVAGSESIGGIFLQTGGTHQISSGVSLIVTGSYNLAGGLLQSGPQAISGSFLQIGGSNQLSSGAALNISGGASYVVTAGTLAADLLSNKGTFNLSAGAVTGAATTSASFNNSGALLIGHGTFTGSIVNNPGATISFNSTVFPLPAAITNNGSITITTGSGTISSEITGTGTLLINGSSAVTITSAGTFSGQTTISSGSVTLAGPVGQIGNNFGGAIGGNVVVQAAGTLNTAADDQIADTALLTVNGGAVNLNAHNQSVGSLSMNGGTINQPTGPGLIVTTGSITAGKAYSAISGPLRSPAAYGVNVASGGTLVVTGLISGTSGNGAAGLTLTGGGTLLLSGVSPILSMDLKSGTAQLSTGGTLGGVNNSVTVESAGVLSLNNQTLATGDLIGAGTIALGGGSLTVNSTGGTFSGRLTGTGSFTKAGVGLLALSGTDSATGATNINAGQLYLSGTSASTSFNIAAVATLVDLGSLTGAPAIYDNGVLVFSAGTGPGITQRTVGSLNLLSSATGNGTVNGTATVAAPASVNTRTLLITSAVNFAGTTGAWKGQLDITGNDLVIHNGSVATLSNQIHNGAAGGIISSTANADPTYLTTIGISANVDASGSQIYGSGTAMGLFDHYSPAATDVIVRYTYYGDANLDGVVDGSDYSRIDNGYSNQLSGWANGDFNLDGTIDGSDFTLIDNAFNTQGPSLNGTATAQLAGASVPEPAAGLVGICLITGALGRRRTKKSLVRQ